MLLTSFQVESSGHVLHAFVNGIHICSHWAQYGQYSFEFDGIAHFKAGINTISLLSGTVGLGNYGAYYEQGPAGIVDAVKLVAPNGEFKDLSTNKWSYKIGLEGFNQEFFNDSKSNVIWHKGPVPKNQMFVWYKTHFKAPLADKPVVIDLLHMGKGTFWVNGHNLGHYWPSFIAANDASCSTCDYRGTYHPNDKCRTNCGNSSQRWYHVPREYLNFGRPNTLVLSSQYKLPNNQCKSFREC